MSIQREWVTPIAAGAFILSAVTGVLMFFHVEPGFSKAAHEWLSWALLGGVLLHVTANLQGLKRHLGQRRGQVMLALFSTLLVVSLVAPASSDEPPFMPAVRALSSAPLSSLAPLAGVSTDQMRQRLQAAGFKPESDQQTLDDLAGSDRRRRMQALGAVFAKADG